MTFWNDINLWNIYFDWLLDRIGWEDQKLEPTLRILHDMDFFWVCPMDKNRAEDGIYRRREFFEDIGLSDAKFGRGCSVFEMLAWFSIRIDEDYTGDPTEPRPDLLLFEMIRNLGLTRISSKNRKKMEENVLRWMNRDFDYDGKGGIFPLRNPSCDQREIELWRQMTAYISEKHHNL